MLQELRSILNPRHVFTSQRITSQPEERQHAKGKHVLSPLIYIIINQIDRTKTIIGFLMTSLTCIFRLGKKLHTISVCQSEYIYVCLSVYLNICPSVNQNIYISVCLFDYLSFHVCVPVNQYPSFSNLTHRHAHARTHTHTHHTHTHTRTSKLIPLRPVSDEPPRLSANQSAYVSICDDRTSRAVESAMLRP